MKDVEVMREQLDNLQAQRRNIKRHVARLEQRIADLQTAIQREHDELNKVDPPSYDFDQTVIFMGKPHIVQLRYRNETAPFEWRYVLVRQSDDVHYVDHYFNVPQDQMHFKPQETSNP